MDEAQLKRTLEWYRSEGRYLLAVEGERLFTGINLSDSVLARQLWQLARSSSAARYAKLTYWRPDGSEIVLRRWVARRPEKTSA